MNEKDVNINNENAFFVSLWNLIIAEIVENIYGTCPLLVCCEFFPAK